MTVVDTLPAGLTATAMSGSGWTCTLGTLTCTRNDVLAVGAFWPPIVITVDVTANAPFSVTNLATVSGGGQISLPNDTATDPTSIHASGSCGTFHAAPAIGAGNAPVSLVFADFDGDGNPDVATANFLSNDVSIRLGNGDGTFGNASSDVVGPQPTAIVAADFDGDGETDLATAN